MDLLTVLEHEVGHVLGIDHQSSGLMADQLFAGVRKSPAISPNLSAVRRVDLASILGEMRALNQRVHW